MTSAGMPALRFPSGSPFDIRKVGAQRQILDRVRRRFVKLTPEEWVRQHLVRTLVDHLGYPIGLISMEATIATLAGPRRPDVVAFGRERRPILIAECKAPQVGLTQAVVDQVSQYNSVTAAPVLLITNGLQHVCWRVDPVARTVIQLSSVPSFDSLT